MGIFSILDIGRSGLQAQKQAMETTSNNISNVNTPNYSRQRPQLESRAHQTSFGYRLGAGGVDLASNLRIHDQFVGKQILEESRLLGHLQSRSEALKRMETIAYGSLKEVSDRANEFFNNVRELSLNPEIPALRVTVRESANALAGGIHSVASSLEGMRGELDSRVTHKVDEINQLSYRLAELNQSISSCPAGRGVPNELLDKRDGVARELSMKLGIQIHQDGRGLMNVYVPGVGTLVHGGNANALEAVRGPAHGDAPENHPGKMEIYLKTPQGYQFATKAIPGGELGGLIEVREGSVNKILAELDRMAYEFSKAVNEKHVEGAANDYGDGDGLFFTDIESREGAALKIDISDDLKKTANAIRVGYDDDSSSDNRLALDIADLQSQKVISPFDPADRVDYTFNDALNNLMSSIGSEVNTADRMTDSQKGIVEQLDNYRKSVSGVSLEEEAVNLMQFQAAFNASAKTMQVADEMLETILSIGN